MRKALSSVPGVRHVEVKFGEKKAIVTVEKDTLNDTAMIDALKDAGFGGEVLP